MGWRPHHLKPGYRVHLCAEPGERENFDESEFHWWIVESCEPVPGDRYGQRRLVMHREDAPSVRFDHVVGGLSLLVDHEVADRIDSAEEEANEEFWVILKPHTRPTMEGPHLRNVPCPTVISVVLEKGVPVVKCDACGKKLQWVR